MRRQQRSRSWMYLLAFVVLVAGTFWARKVEVRERDLARSAETGLSFNLSADLADELAMIGRCIEEGRCSDPSSLGLVPGTTHNSSPTDESWWLALSGAFWPEYDEYFTLTFDWEVVVRSATTTDGTLVDSAELAQLLDGPLADQMADELASANRQLTDRRDRSRMLTRVFGWGWKFTLAGLVVLPIAAGVIEERRRRMMNVHWKAQQAAEQPPVTISATTDVSA